MVCPPYESPLAALPLTDLHAYTVLRRRSRQELVVEEKGHKRAFGLAVHAGAAVSRTGLRSDRRYGGDLMGVSGSAPHWVRL